MSWLEEEEDNTAITEDSDDVDVCEPKDSSDTDLVENGNALYPGDRGELRLDTRRALVQLLSGPSLEARRHSKLWLALLRDETILQSRLSDLFLELIIDRELQVAFTRQADTAELKVPLLLRRSQLTFLDSVLLLLLRQKLSQAEMHGERAVVSINEILSDLAVYERTGNTDHAGFNSRIKASIEKFKKRSILQKIRSSEERFEVSPTLKLLFSADRIDSLMKLYERMGAGEATSLEQTRQAVSSTASMEEA